MSFHLLKPMEQTARGVSRSVNSGLRVMLTVSIGSSVVINIPSGGGVDGGKDSACVWGGTVCVLSESVLSDSVTSLRQHRPWALCPWDFPGKNAE